MEKRWYSALWMVHCKWGWPEINCTSWAMIGSELNCWSTSDTEIKKRPKKGNTVNVENVALATWQSYFTLSKINILIKNAVSASNPKLFKSNLSKLEIGLNFHQFAGIFQFITLQKDTADYGQFQTYCVPLEALAFLHCMTDLHFFCKRLHTGSKLCGAKQRQKGLGGWLFTSLPGIKEGKQKKSKCHNTKYWSKMCTL